jgi:hypothetical protein
MSRTMAPFKSNVRALRDAGKALEAAGRILLSATAPPDAVRWAAAVLETYCGCLQRPPHEVSELLDLVQHESRWPGRSLRLRPFGASRCALSAGNLSVPDVVTGVLYLSENVAKLAYNATAPVDPFDADAGE